MNSQKPEFKAPTFKATSLVRFKYTTEVVQTVGLGREVADRIQRKLDSASSSGLRFVGMLPISSECVLVFEKEAQ